MGAAPGGGPVTGQFAGVVYVTSTIAMHSTTAYIGIRIHQHLLPHPYTMLRMRLGGNSWLCRWPWGIFYF